MKESILINIIERPIRDTILTDDIITDELVSDLILAVVDSVKEEFDWIIWE